MEYREGEAPNARVRSDRFLCIENEWYFNVRGGDLCGPFASREDAESELVFFLLERGITVLSPTAEQLEAAMAYDSRYSRSVISMS